MSLQSWRKARNWKDPAPPAPKPVEPEPAPESADVEMDDATRAFDLGLTGPATIAEQEHLEDVRAAQERNPGGFLLAKMVIESMNEHDKRRT